MYIVTEYQMQQLMNDYRRDILLEIQRQPFKDSSPNWLDVREELSYYKTKANLAEKCINAEKEDEYDNAYNAFKIFMEFSNPPPGTDKG